ncbi:MAG: homogentisate 1,2-dioxygenase [Deltaproteobacteria bacterium]|nr:homogentisate 1,2-dioxygenase [Deltaproteobacteria bacterium]
MPVTTTTRSFSVMRGVTRVMFGRGVSERLLPELDSMGISRVLVIATPGRRRDAARVAEGLGPKSVGVLATAKEHVPSDVATEGRREAERLGADAVLAYGGGSAIGLAKAIAIEGPERRVVAIPTTYSGSEMTPLWGITDERGKRTGRDERARPALVAYDPGLTADLPRDVAIASVWNAMAHACATLWMPHTDRASRLAAEEGLRLLASSVVGLAASGDEATRTNALEGAYLAAMSFADAGVDLHHKLCHVLGGSYGLPHAKTHAALLPHVARFLSGSAPEAMAAIARALGTIDPVLGLERLASASGVARGLAELGLPAEAPLEIARSVSASSVASPRVLEVGALAEMLDRARSPIAVATEPLVRGPERLAYIGGFGGTHESEALDGALPKTQNTPRPSPYGLYPELLSGTPFTERRDRNSKVFMYRIRPSFAHGPMTKLPGARFCAELGDVEPNRTRWNPLPIPSGLTRIDFLDGLVTLGGSGDPSSADAGYAVHLYSANADMVDRAFSSSDGDLLVVPQSGTLDVRTELGWLRASPGTIVVIPRGVKFAVGLPDGHGRGWMAEVFGTKLRLPERGPIGSNGLADTRHFLGPVASYEDRTTPNGFEIVTKLGGHAWTARQEHSPFDVVAWHGNHVPRSYDLMLFNAMGSATWDHPDPSIHTVLTAPLDDHGRAACDFVVFRGRWDVAEHSFRPPFMHRNAASEVNGVIADPSPSGGYDPGCTFVSPLLTSHGISTKSYDAVLEAPDEIAEGPRRLPDESLWIMFESALPFRFTAWAKGTPLRDEAFLSHFDGMKKRFTGPL